MHFFPIPPRGNAELLAEDIGHVALRGEAARISDLSKGHRPDREKFLSPRDATGEDVLMRRLAEGGFERLRERSFRLIDQGCEIAHSQILIKMSLDVVIDLCPQPIDKGVFGGAMPAWRCPVSKTKQRRCNGDQRAIGEEISVRIASFALPPKLETKLL